MSLVAYGSSSDDSDDDGETPILEQNKISIIKKNETSSPSDLLTDGTPSSSNDGVEENNRETSRDTNLEDNLENPHRSGGRLRLPPPKQRTNGLSQLSTTMTAMSMNPSIFGNLPMSSSVGSETVTNNHHRIPEEEDDEFLHIRPKNEQITEKIQTDNVGGSNNSSGTIRKYPLNSNKSGKKPQQILIPSLKDFDDIIQDKKPLSKCNVQKSGIKTSGLLSILPKVKQNTIKSTLQQENTKVSMMNSNKILIPRVVANQTRKPQSSNNGGSMAMIHSSNMKAVKEDKKSNSTSISTSAPLKSVGSKSIVMEKDKKTNPAETNDSDDDDDQRIRSTKDFFALNDDGDDDSDADTTENIKNTQICEKELNDLIAKRAAEMRKAKESIDMMKPQAHVGHVIDHSSMTEEESFDGMKNTIATAATQYQDNQGKEVLDSRALEELVGSRGKRKRLNMKNIEVIELSGEKVLPDREDWMRTALAASTTEDPNANRRGHKEPGGNLKRRHQITYLMDRAIANDADLQAMWAANQQTRRITSGKYGF